MRKKKDLTKSLALSLALGSALALPLGVHAQDVSTVSNNIEDATNTGYAQFTSGTYSVTANNGNNAFNAQANGTGAIDVLGGATATVSATNGSNMLSATSPVSSSSSLGVVFVHSQESSGSVAPASLTLSSNTENNINSTVNLGSDGAGVLAGYGGTITMTAPVTTITATDNSAISASGLIRGTDVIGPATITVTSADSINLSGGGVRGVAQAVNGGNVRLTATNTVTTTATAKGNPTLRASGDSTLKVNAGNFKAVANNQNAGGIVSQSGSTLAIETTHQGQDSVVLAGGITVSTANRDAKKSSLTITSGGGVSQTKDNAVISATGASKDKSSDLTILAKQDNISLGSTSLTSNFSNVSLTSNEKNTEIKDVTANNSTLNVVGKTGVTAGNVTASGETNATIYANGDSPTTTIGDVKVGEKDNGAKDASVTIGGTNGTGAYTVGKVINHDGTVTIGGDSATDITTGKVHAFNSEDTANNTTIKGENITTGPVILGNNPVKPQKTNVTIEATGSTNVGGVINFGNEVTISNGQDFFNQLSIGTIDADTLNQEDDGRIPLVEPGTAIIAGKGSTTNINAGFIGQINGNVRVLQGTLNSKGIANIDGDLNATASTLNNEGGLVVTKNLTSTNSTVTVKSSLNVNGTSEISGGTLTSEGNTTFTGDVTVNKGAAVSVTADKLAVNPAAGNSTTPTVKVSGENTTFTATVNNIEGGGNFETTDKGKITLTPSKTAVVGKLSSDGEESVTKITSESSELALTVGSAVANTKGQVIIGSENAKSVTISGDSSNLGVEENTLTGNVGAFNGGTVSITSGDTITGGAFVANNADSAITVSGKGATTIDSANAQGTSSIKVNNTNEEGAVTVNNTLTTGEGSTVAIGNSATFSTTVTGKTSGQGNTTINGKVVRAGDIDAQKGGTVTVGNKETETTTLTGTTQTESGTVDVHGKAITTGSAVTTSGEEGNKGTINIGDDTTTSVTLGEEGAGSLSAAANSDINVKGTTVKGTSASATGDNSAVNIASKGNSNPSVTFTGEVSATETGAVSINNGNNAGDSAGTITVGNVNAASKGSVKLGNNATTSLTTGSVTSNSGTVEGDGLAIKTTGDVSSAGTADAPSTVTLGSDATTSLTIGEDGANSLAANANGTITAKGTEIKAKDVTATGENGAVRIASKGDGTPSVTLTGNVNATQSGKVSINNGEDAGDSAGTLSVAGTVTAESKGNVALGNDKTTSLKTGDVTSTSGTITADGLTVTTGNVSSTGTTEDPSVVTLGNDKTTALNIGEEGANNLTAGANGTINANGAKVTATDVSSNGADANVNIVAKGDDPSVAIKGNVLGDNAGTIKVNSEEDNGNASISVGGKVTANGESNVTLGNNTTTVTNITGDVTANQGTIVANGTDVTTGNVSSTGADGKASSVTLGNENSKSVTIGNEGAGNITAETNGTVTAHGAKVTATDVTSNGKDANVTISTKGDEPSVDLKGTVKATSEGSVSVNSTNETAGITVGNGVVAEGKGTVTLGNDATTATTITGDVTSTEGTIVANGATVSTTGNVSSTGTTDNPSTVTLGNENTTALTVGQDGNGALKADTNGTVSANGTTVKAGEVTANGDNGTVNIASKGDGASVTLGAVNATEKGKVNVNNDATSATDSPSSITVGGAVNATGEGTVGLGNKATESTTINGDVTATSGTIVADGKAVATTGNVKATGEEGKPSSITLGNEESTSLTVGNNGEGDITAETNGTVNANGGTVKANNVSANGKDSLVNVTSKGDGEGVSLAGEVTATNGAVNINAGDNADSPSNISIAKGLTATSEGAINVGNDNTATATIGENISASGDKSAVNVKGDNINANGDVTAESQGSVTLGDAETRATVKGAIKGDNGDVTVNGATITAESTATAENGGTVTIGGNDSDTVTVKGDVSATGENSALTIDGKNVTAEKAVSSSNEGSVTLGNAESENVTASGAVKADSGDVTLHGKNVTAGSDVTSENDGSVIIGDPTSTKATVGGNITATEGSVTLNGAEIESTGKTVTASGSQDKSGNVTIGNADGSTKVVNLPTGDGTSLSATDHGTIDINGEKVTAPTISATGIDSAVHVTSKGDKAEVNVKGGITADKTGEVTINNNSDDGKAPITVEGDIASNNNGSVKVGNVNSETVNVGNLTTDASEDGKTGGNIEVTGKAVTTKDNIASNKGGNISVTGNTLTLGNPQTETTVSATGSAQNESGETVDSTVKLEQKEGDLNLKDQNVSLSATDGGDIVVNNLGGTLTTNTDKVNATGNGSSVLLNGNGVDTNGLQASEGGEITVNGVKDGSNNAETSAVNLNGTTTATGEGSKVVATGNPVGAENISALKGGKVEINGQTALGKDAERADVTITGTVTASGEGSDVSIKGKAVTANTLNATDNGNISIDASASAKVGTLNQEGGTISLSAPSVAVDSYTANNATIAIDGGSTAHIGALNGENNTFEITPNLDPTKSSYLILDKGVDKTQNLVWVVPTREEMTTLEKTLQDNDGSGKGISRIPFASVLEKGKEPLFAVGETPQVKLSNGLEDATLVVGEESASKANDNDKLFFDEAQKRLDGNNVDLTKGDFYYAYLKAPRASADAIHAINGSTIGALLLGTDMIPSARNYAPQREDNIHASYKNEGYKGLGSKLHNQHLNLGYDTFKDLGNNRHNISVSALYDGGTGSLSYTSSDIKEHRYGVRAEDRMHFNDGAYANYAVELGKVKNRFNFDMNGNMVGGSYTQGYQKVSAEYGMHREHARGYYTVPQVQFQYAHVGSASLAPTEGTTLNLSGVNSVQGRLGMVVGRHVDVGAYTYNMYLSANLFHEFNGNQDLNLLGKGDTNWTRSIGRTWYDFGAGVNAFLGQGTTAYLAMNKTFGREYGKNYEVQAGVKLTF